HPTLEPTNVKPLVREVHLRPLEAAELAHTQAVPVGEQDHGRVPVAVAPALASDFDELIHLGFGQVLPGSEIGVGSADDCPIYGARAGLQLDDGSHREGPPTVRLRLIIRTVFVCEAVWSRRTTPARSTLVTHVGLRPRARLMS